MKNKHALLTGIVSITLIMLGMYWLSDIPSVRTELNPVEGDQANEMSIDRDSRPVTVPIVKKVFVKPKIAEEDWTKAGMSLRIDDAASFYAENMRYPKYSKPLAANDWVAFNPRPFIAKDIPLEIQPGLSAAILLPQYVASRHKDLPVQVRINGIRKDLRVESISVYLASDTEREHAIALQYNSSTENTLIYANTYPSAGLPQGEQNKSYIHADIMFSDKALVTVSAAYLLEDDAATLISLGDAYIEGPHLMVPASFEVELPGLYRFQANLIEQDSKLPISHLNATFSLSKNANETTLKVHAETLRLKGSPGPYILTDINLTRSPGTPGERTGYGSTLKKSYDIAGFDLSYYSEEEYINPQNQRRLEFLQKMAGKL